MEKDMEIVYITWAMEEKVVKQLNKWIQNGHDINKSFIKITHTGDFYAMFYDANLDEPVANIPTYDPETTNMTV